MNLFEIIGKIAEFSKDVPNVRTVKEGNIYTILNAEDAELDFSAIVITQQTHRHTSNESTIYNFVIYFVDRLTESGDNKLFVQSEGIDALSRIGARIEEEFGNVGEYTIDTFTESFASVCAGAYITVGIEVEDMPYC